MAAGRQSNVVIPRRGKWCHGLEQLGAAEDAAVAALWLVRLDARARAGFWLLGRRRLLWMRSYTAFGLRCTGDEDSLSLVALACSATADAVLAKRTLIAALLSRRISLLPHVVSLLCVTPSLSFSFFLRHDVSFVVDCGV